MKYAKNYINLIIVVVGSFKLPKLLLLVQHSLFEKASSTSFPFSASSIIYCPPSVAEVAQKVADIGGKALIGGNAEIIQSKGYSSDEELDDLDSPFTLILNDTHKISIENARFKLLREAWSP